MEFRKSSEDIDDAVIDVIMPPQHQQQHQHRQSSPPGEELRSQMGMYRRTATVAASNSFDEVDGGLSSQSFNRVLNPTSPSKTPRPHVEQRTKRRMVTMTMHAMGKVHMKYIIFSTLLFVGSMVIVRTMTIHSVATSSSNGESSVRRSGRKTRRGKHVVYPQDHSRSMLRKFGGRHPRIVDVAVLGKLTQDSKSTVSFIGGKRIYPMQHNLGWSSVVESDGAYSEEVEGDTVDEGSVVDDNEPQCVPMAQWQTTSYPNCNSVHEIDMVRSSGPGSYTFPSYRHESHRRRSITSHPRILLEYFQDLHLRYPPRHKVNAKTNAQGLMKEESLEFLGQGWFRSAWEMYTEEIPDYDIDEDEWGYEESVVLKTLRIEREFIPEYYELHRRDALAMERLTFSPYVLDIYGYCGQSAINELANFGIEGMSSLEKIARSFRGMDDIEPVSKIKLQLASMVAAGVSHVHSIDYADFPFPVENDSEDIPSGEEEGIISVNCETKQSLLNDIAKGNVKVRSNATLVHYDLNPRNIAVVKRGKPKLNDFNVANFLTWDVKNNRTCGFPGRFREPWWRSPEEMHHVMPENYTNPAPLTEKIDIYSLGNILMEILTTHAPWGTMVKGGDKEEETRPKVARGELPEWPDDFNLTKMELDPALTAIHDAMKKCLTLNPEDRPTAGVIAAELFEAIDNLPKGFGDKEKWKRERELQDQLEEERRHKVGASSMEKGEEEFAGGAMTSPDRHSKRPRKEHHRDVYEV